MNIHDLQNDPEMAFERLRRLLEDSSRMSPSAPISMTTGVDSIPFYTNPDAKEGQRTLAEAAIALAGSAPYAFPARFGRTFGPAASTLGWAKRYLPNDSTEALLYGAQKLDHAARMAQRAATGIAGPMESYLRLREKAEAMKALARALAGRG